MLAFAISSPNISAVWKENLWQPYPLPSVEGRLDEQKQNQSVVFNEWRRWPHLCVLALHKWLVEIQLFVCCLSFRDDSWKGRSGGPRLSAFHQDLRLKGIRRADMTAPDWTSGVVEEGSDVMNEQAYKKLIQFWSHINLFFSLSSSILLLGYSYRCLTSLSSSAF